MSEHFIKNIEITTFKCFDHFKASGFKRVNLIAGKNNIGKTALLEALSLNVRSCSVEAMVVLMMLYHLHRNLLDTCFSTNDIPKKGNTTDWIRSYSAFKIESNQKNIHFYKSKKTLTTSYTFIVNKEEEVLQEKELREDLNLDFLTNNKNNQQYTEACAKSDLIFPSKVLLGNLVNYYQSIQEENREDEISDYISHFDPTIKRLKFFANEDIKLEKNEKYQHINTFGDGLKAYLAIILAIFHCKNSCLFIDELENGIHYTQFDQLWEIILTASKQVNCQVFATTHSKECIESYARTAKKIADKDISFITLVNNRENKIEAINYRYETLQNSLSQDHEVRGW